ncbi:protein FAM50 homolog [Ischnura elegans]|uniref:protein FAM50 homolog n=1 Tax=Ischnura elegans TaxID=197161 RepID=UPI001ED8982A|nr:protein FAM50 homolog [Ischnura elegans]XP_046402128.1 protein FAM50 homolog [Ischnura elegans]
MAHYKGAASEAGRAMHLMKKREMAQQEIEFRKKKIEEDLKISNIENKFAAHYDAVEQQLKSSTIGLVTLDEMKAKQESIVKQREKKLAQKQLEKEREEMRLLEAKRAEKYRQKRQIQALSFSMEDGEEEGDDDDDEEDEVEIKKEPVKKEEIITEANGKADSDEGKSPSASECMGSSHEKEEDERVAGGDSDGSGEDSDRSKSNDFKPPVRKKIRKNPDVDTSFLPDREREEEENRLREELRQEWASKQASLKEEEIDITFSYWDGSGHRRTVRMKKGNSMYQFLQRCLDLLRKEFSELKTVSADQLMYVKEDLILPHHYTFYDFIVTKARGKSGPLFTFDVHDDVRLVSDASVEKEESHAGKVLLRHWYERNKHIFPASRWEPYDPTKSYDKYTVSDKCKK